jgi:hypothetical protein
VLFTDFSPRVRHMLLMAHSAVSVLYWLQLGDLFCREPLEDPASRGRW